jgi:formylglycine-generating enzyme required for sulfatase activity
MVKIPGGTFKMGAVNGEEGASSDEFPQHKVTVKDFWMAKFVVTQEQWKTIALLPKINTDLKADPSHFKGKNFPVERVSWHQAKEFCDRLSKKTGKTFDLPTEAQWEYACRARTTTPFHFGPTITTDGANASLR